MNFNNETGKYINIREEFLFPANKHRTNGKHNKNCNEFWSKWFKKIFILTDKNLQKLQTCGYYILLALIVISCTCLLLTPFWSFSSLIFGRNDGYIYYLSYTLFCGLMCCIIWSNKINLNLLCVELQNCNIESIICWIFYMFCCILLWGMASYFGGFFFIYLWYCSQEIHSNDNYNGNDNNNYNNMDNNNNGYYYSKRINIFDSFMKYNKNEIDCNKRMICCYFYCLMNFETNIHKIYKDFIFNKYYLINNSNNDNNDDIEEQFFGFNEKEMRLMMNKQWFANWNLSHNLPFILGIAGYHFMIWFGVFYLKIADWSFLITVCNDIILLLCLFTACFINLCINNRCKKQINLHWLKYFNLENIDKKQIKIINNEVNNIYLDLNQRINTMQIMRQQSEITINSSILPIYLINLIISYLYIQDIHQIQLTYSPKKQKQAKYTQ